jgi:hypothetical protein
MESRVGLLCIVKNNKNYKLTIRQYFGRSWRCLFFLEKNISNKYLDPLTAPILTLSSNRSFYATRNLVL